MTDGKPVGPSTLTSSILQTNSAKYIAAKHFFRFIRPGTVCVNAAVTGSTNLLASAYVDDWNSTLTVVLLNSSSNALSPAIHVPAVPVISGFQSFTSSSSYYWQHSWLSVTNNTVAVTVPGYGIVTVFGVARAIDRTKNALDKCREPGKVPSRYEEQLIHDRPDLVAGD
jgi:hypothetical protein